MRLRSSVLTTILAALIYLHGLAAVCAASPQLLTILHTNDHHGRFWQNADGEYGIAARKTLADNVRAEVRSRGGALLLLDAGDVNTGVPESDMLDAEPDIRGMNAMGYDAMAVGNHEFDNPLDVLRRQQSLMSFPLLSANIYDREGKRLFSPCHRFVLNGLRVAVFGLTTETTAVIGNPRHIGGLTFRPAVEEAGQLVPKLRAQADVVIALAHLGYAADGRSGSVALAEAVPGIDLIVDGHSHTALTSPVVVNGTVIVQAGEYGKYLGRVDLEYEDGQVRLAGGRLMPVNLTGQVVEDGKKKRLPPAEPVAQDLEMTALLAPFQERGTQALHRLIGRIDAALPGERETMRSAETALGNLACRALLEKVGADVAVMNSGGIRAGLPAGDIAYRDVLTVKPFGNTICTVAMTGAELAAYLQAAASMPPGTGSFAQFAGVGFLLRQGVIGDITVNGKTLDPARNYTVAMESYIASGGDGYPKVTDHPSFVDTGYVDADALREFIASRSPLRAGQFEPSGAIRRE